MLLDNTHRHRTGRAWPAFATLGILCAGTAIPASLPAADPQDDPVKLARALKLMPDRMPRLLPHLKRGLPAAETALCKEAILGLLKTGFDPKSTQRKKGFVLRQHLSDAMLGLWHLDRAAFASQLGGAADHPSALAADVLEGLGRDGLEWAKAEALSHALPRVRAQAAALLGRAREGDVAPRLSALLASDASEEVREMCARALSRVGTDAEVPALSRTAQQDASRKVRRAAVLALGWLGTRAAGDALFKDLQGKDPPADAGDALRILCGGQARKGLEAHRAWWERHRPAPGYDFDGVVYSPKRKRRCEFRRIVHVFDVSGSIGGRAHQDQYAAMIQRLREDTCFDAIAFSMYAPRPWKGTLVPATRDSREAAAAWIRGFDGKRGTTPLSAAIRKALCEYDADDIVLCTDGGGNIGVEGADLVDYVQALNVCRRVRFQGVPVGNLLEGVPVDRPALMGPGDGNTLRHLTRDSGGQYVEGGLEAALRLESPETRTEPPK